MTALPVSDDEGGPRGRGRAFAFSWLDVRKQGEEGDQPFLGDDVACLERGKARRFTCLFCSPLLHGGKAEDEAATGVEPSRQRNSASYPTVASLRASLIGW